MIATIRRAAPLALGAVVLAIGFASAQSDDRSKSIEAAKKEGKLVWYTSTNVTESKPLLDDFEKAYGIRGEIFRASGEIFRRSADSAGSAGVAPMAARQARWGILRVGMSTLTCAGKEWAGCW